MKKSITVLFGGRSSEHEVSCVSAANVFENINKDKFDVYRLGIDKNGIWYLYTGSAKLMRDGGWLNDSENLFPAFISPCAAHHGFMVLDKPQKKYEIVRVDCVFPVLHGLNGEDGTMQGLLEIAGIPYVGCDTLSSAAAMDKEVTKIIAQNANIPVTPYISARNVKELDVNALVAESEERFGYPVFVKPCNAGSSVGVTKARDRASLVKGIVDAFEQDNKLLIERFMPGKEIEVAVLGNDTLTVSECGEIAPNADFYDYSTKYSSDSVGYYIPARISKDVSDSIRDAAAEIFKALGCSGFSRVDFFANGEGWCFNEINTIPGFTSISMYPSLMKHSGISYGELIEKLIELALEKHA